jgi:hypothetical protein
MVPGFYHAALADYMAALETTHAMSTRTVERMTHC